MEKRDALKGITAALGRVWDCVAEDSPERPRNDTKTRQKERAAAVKVGRDAFIKAALAGLAAWTVSGQSGARAWAGVLRKALGDELPAPTVAEMVQHALMEVVEGVPRDVGAPLAARARITRWQDLYSFHAWLKQRVSAKGTSSAAKAALALLIQFEKDFEGQGAALAIMGSLLTTKAPRKPER